MTRRLLALGAGALLMIGLAATPASAKDGDVTRRGMCSAQSHWKLKAGARNEGIEVEFEVDSDVAGQAWTVMVADNGTTVFTGQRTTQPPSGSFSVGTTVADHPGPDTILGQARNQRTGETCRGTVTV